MKKFLSLILCVVLACSFLGCQNAEDKKSTDTVISFQDKNLEKIIRKKINKPTGDILKSDVKSITELDASLKVINCTDDNSSKIYNLNGIENLINLKVLKLAFNNISDLSQLKNLTSLTDLDITANKINNIDPLKNLTKLTSLKLGGNEITSVNSLSNLKQLTSLNLAGNNFDNIDALKELVNLEILFIGDNKLSDISVLKNFSLMHTLYLRNSSLDNSDLASLEKLDKLKELYLDGNNISDYTTIKNIIKNLWAFNSPDNDSDETLKIKNFIKESHSWVKLLMAAQYHTTGKIIGVVRCDDNTTQDIQEIAFDNSSDKKIIKLLKKYYSSDNLINAQLYRWGFVYINNNLYKLNGLFTEPYVIGRTDAISLTLDQTDRKVVQAPKEQPGHTYPSSGFLYNSIVEFIYIEVIKDANGNWVVSSIQNDSYDPTRIELSTNN